MPNGAQWQEADSRSKQIYIRWRSCEQRHHSASAFSSHLQAEEGSPAPQSQSRGPKEKKSKATYKLTNSHKTVGSECKTGSCGAEEVHSKGTGRENFERSAESPAVYSTG